MNAIDTNKLVKLLNAKKPLSAVKVHTKLKTDYGIVIKEYTGDGSSISFYLTLYKYMIDFAKEYHCGMLIEANGNVPNYYLY